MNNIRQRHYITLDSFIASLRRHVTNVESVNLSLPVGNEPNSTTNMILGISRQFLSLNPHANESMRHFLINELLPKVELLSVKQLFIDLLNEYPPNHQHHDNDITEMHAIEDDDTNNGDTTQPGSERVSDREAEGL